MNAPDIKELFKLSNEMAEYVGTNKEGLDVFIKNLGNMRHFTVHNQMIIQAYIPYLGLEKINDIRTFEEWQEAGIMVNPDAYPIWVMEKNDDSEVGYSPRAVYDVSQTNGVYNNQYDEGYVTEGMIISAPCKIEYVERPKVMGTKAMYRADEGIIEVTRGFNDYTDIVKNLSAEYAHYYFHEGETVARAKKSNNGEGRTVYPRAVYIDMAQIASAATLAKYNLVKEQSFDTFLTSMKELAPKNRKMQLAQIGYASQKIIDKAEYSIGKLYEFNKGADMDVART